MVTDITKEDWETAVKQYEAMIINGEINRQIHFLALEHCKKKAEELKDKDEAPEDVKEIIKEVAKND